MKSGLKLLASSLFAVSLAASATDIPAGPWAGTWNFNLEKSKFPGPAPLVDSVIIQPDGTVTVQEKSSEGKSTIWSYKPQLGKIVSVEGRGQNVTVLASKPNSHRTEQVWNFNGRRAKSYAVLSKDGKTQTFHMQGTDKNGKPFEELVVFEKQ